MTTVNMLEAKTSLSRLVEAVESGAEEEIIIARNGKPAAKLVPLDVGAKKKRRLGLARDKYPPLDFEAFQAMDAEIEALFLGETEKK
ncbi:type II toxin-antitoxin system prevent-host-death family antitoxin [Aquamicrobium sp. LC103]|uniref:type II toxin-antitoxin system Phd/YefM family antitoxin n=1 Tax=Aquamicrobium sp. LC103 TaxID=1120658 RepID=UPI00063E952E|nr:type II toxin-antitoxin system prevent-host-death family antitoxin [Aquamicrobium sp. LC103]TKT81134.1 type II toxin-antitoxin system prevent-host-death family antitoxin [Aquamicrobium sp. LC103]